MLWATTLASWGQTLQSLSLISLGKSPWCPDSGLYPQSTSLQWDDRRSCSSKAWQSVCHWRMLTVGLWSYYWRSICIIACLRPRVLGRSGIQGPLAFLCSGPMSGRVRGRLLQPHDQWQLASTAEGRVWLKKAICLPPNDACLCPGVTLRSRP